MQGGGNCRTLCTLTKLVQKLRVLQCCVVCCSVSRTLSHTGRAQLRDLMQTKAARQKNAQQHLQGAGLCPELSSYSSQYVATTARIFAGSWTLPPTNLATPAHETESCHIYICHVTYASVMSRINVTLPPTNLGAPASKTESCHVCMSHVTYERVMSHLNESCPSGTYKCDSALNQFVVVFCSVLQCLEVCHESPHTRECISALMSEVVPEEVVL